MTDEYYMNLALEEARKAQVQDEVPIGCIIVHNNKVIAASYNRKTIDNIATYHAEVLAINEACRVLGTWYLDECILYTTVEPCMMCTGAIIQARIPKVIYGAANGAFGCLSKLNSKVKVVGGILEKECSIILSEFFREKRRFNN